MEKVFYWANVLGGLESVLRIFQIIALLIFAVWIGVYSCEYFDSDPDDDEIKLYGKGALLSFIVSVIFSLATIFIPDKETYLLMQGSKAVEQMYNKSETLQELPKNTVNLLNEYVKTLTEELKEAQEEE